VEGAAEVADTGSRAKGMKELLDSCRYSVRSFSFAASVDCHCMFPGSSMPLRFSAWM
jgi:hypothetical protein